MGRGKEGRRFAVFVRCATLLSNYCLKTRAYANDFFGFLYAVQEIERKSLEDGGAKEAWRTVSFSDRQ